MYKIISSALTKYISNKLFTKKTCITKTVWQFSPTIFLTTYYILNAMFNQCIALWKQKTYNQFRITNSSVCNNLIQLSVLVLQLLTKRLYKKIPIQEALYYHINYFMLTLWVLWKLILKKKAVHSIKTLLITWSRNPNRQKMIVYLLDSQNSKYCGALKVFSFKSRITR